MAFAAIVGGSKTVDPIAAGAVRVIGTVPGQVRAAGPRSARLPRGHRAELLESEIVKVIGKLLCPAVVQGIAVAEAALVALAQRREQHAPLVQVRRADRCLCLFACVLQDGHEDRHQQRDDGNDDKQLDECERTAAGPAPQMRSPTRSTLCHICPCQGEIHYTAQVLACAIKTLPVHKPRFPFHLVLGRLP